MEYSIEDITKLAKVSVRTLHYYDEIGLLKPVIRMENGRRYYAEEQALRLMDIIFLKKMGFSLKKIEAMLNLGNKDKRALMIAKKEFLQKEMKRIKDLIKSIDITLEFYFKGENKNYNQILKQFELFQKSAKEDKQSFLKEFGSLEDKESEKLKNMSVEEQLKYVEELHKNVDMKQYAEKLISCFKKLIEAIENNLKENSKEVQDLMKDYYEILKMVYPMSKKKWLGMGIAIGESKENYTMYAKMHPKLPEFFAEAIKIYGENLEE